jgi:hypothetical protein
VILTQATGHAPFSPCPCFARSGVATTRMESFSRPFYVLILTLAAAVRMVDFEANLTIPGNDFAGEFGTIVRLNWRLLKRLSFALHCGCQPFMASL